MIRLIQPEEKLIRVQELLTRPHSEDLLGLLVAAGSVLELALPFEGLGAGPGERLSLVITLERQGESIERIPASGELEVTVPAEDFEVHFWHV